MKKLPSWAKLRKQRAITYGAATGVRNSLAYPTLAGPPINEQVALSITAFWNATNIISNSIACLETGISERLEKGGRRPATELPLYDVIARKPNDFNTAYKFRQSIMTHALTTGNGYAEIVRAGGQVRSLELLEPRNVEPYVDRADGKQYYRFLTEQKTVPASQIIHVSGLGWDGVRGYSPVSLARETLGLTKSQEEHQAGVMGNNATPNGFIELPGNPNETQRNRTRSDIELMHKGTANAGTLGLLWGGAKWVQTSFSPADAELLLSRAFSVAEIARLFNIPQHMIGLLEHATFSNIEQQLMEFYTFTLLPWLTCIEQEMDSKLLTTLDRSKYFVYHDVSSLMRADTASQTAKDVADFEHGFASQNEIKRRRGENPIEHPNADKHFIPVNNLMAVEDMPIGPAPAKPEPPELIAPTDPPEDRSKPTIRPEVLKIALEDPIGRMVKVSCNAARQASKKPRFDLWAEKWQARHVATVTAAMGPTLQIAAEITGRTFDADVIARTIVDPHIGEFLSLAKTYPPDELPAAVERYCLELEANQTSALVRDLIGATS